MFEFIGRGSGAQSVERERRATTMPSIANRVRKSGSARAGPKRGFAPMSVGAASDAMAGSLAASAGGVMRPEMPASAFKQRRVEMEEEEKGSVALRTVTYPVFGASTEATYTSEDGSSFTLSTQNAPMHIPGSATNLTASLINASVPYVWDNLKQDQVINVDGEFSRRVILNSDVSFNYTLYQPSTSTPFRSGFGTDPASAASTHPQAYLSAAETQPFWFRPALEDAFDNMGLEGELKYSTPVPDPNFTSKWKDLTTGTSHEISASQYYTSQITLTASITASRGDRVIQGTAIGSVREDTPSSTTLNVVFDRTKFNNFVDTASIIVRTLTESGSIGASNTFTEETRSIDSGGVSTPVAFGCVPLRLTGRRLTGSPMLEMTSEKQTTTGFGANQRVTSSEMSFGESTMQALQSIPSNSLSSNENRFFTGEIHAILHFDTAMLSQMAYIAKTMRTHHTTNNQNYMKAVQKSAIVLASFDINPVSANASTTFPGVVRVLLICDPLHCEDPSNDISVKTTSWKIVIDVGSQGREEVAHYVTSSTMTSTQFSHLDLVFRTNSTLRFGRPEKRVNTPIWSGSDTVAGANNRVRLDRPVVLQLFTNKDSRTNSNINDPNPKPVVRFAVQLAELTTTRKSNDSFSFGTLEAGSFPDWDGKSGWYNLNVSNFRLGSARHRVAQGFYTGTSASNSIESGNFDPDLIITKGDGSNVTSSNGNVVYYWRTGDYGGSGPSEVNASIYFGDIFAVDNKSTYDFGSGEGEIGGLSELDAQFKTSFQTALSQQFLPSDANPFLQLPTLDARSAIDYTTSTVHNYTFKIPAGEYPSVQAYVDAVNEALSESTESACGVRDLLSLDVDFDGLNGNGGVNYKLETHLNRPISELNPMLDAETTGSGVEALLNQRIGVNMQNTVADRAGEPQTFNVVREAGDYVLLFTHQDEAGDRDKNGAMYLVHKPSLTVTMLFSELVTNSVSPLRKVADVEVVVPLQGDPVLVVMVVAQCVLSAGIPSEIQIATEIVSVQNGGRETSTFKTAGPTSESSVLDALRGFTARVLIPYETASGGGNHFFSVLTSVVDSANLSSTNKVFRGNSGVGWSPPKSNNAQISGDPDLSHVTVQQHTSNLGNEAATYPIGSFGNNTNYALVDAAVVNESAFTSSNVKVQEVAITVRIVDNLPTSNTHYKMFVEKYDLTANAPTITVGSVSTDVQSLFVNAELGTSVGINANVISDYMLASGRLPKLTSSKDASKKLAVNIPEQDSSQPVAAILEALDTISGFQLRLYRGSSASKVTHDVGDGFCTRALFTQTQAGDDQLSLVMDQGRVHNYLYTNTGVVEGTSPVKPASVTDTWFRFAQAPPTSAQAGTMNAVASVVRDIAGSTSETHLFFVGDMTHFQDGTTVEVLAAPNFIHRTSANLAGNQNAIRYFKDLKLPTRVVFNPYNIMDEVWNSGEEPTQYTDLDHNLIDNGVHITASYDLFINTLNVDPLISYMTAESITIPKGNYTFSSLGRAINELLHELNNDKFGTASISFEDNASLQKLFASAKLSTSMEDDLPSRIKLSWNSGPFQALFEPDEIELVASGPTPKMVAKDVSYTATGLSAIRTIYVKANFVHGGINPQRQKSQILASIPVDKEPGQTIVVNPSQLLKVSAQNFLNQGDANTDLEFIITDEKGDPIPIGTSHPWSVNVLIEWEQDINLARLRQSGSETRHR